MPDGVLLLGPQAASGQGPPLGDRAWQGAGTGWQHSSGAELHAVLASRERRVFVREAPSSQG